MLVLGRKVGQSIRIGDQVRLTVIEIGRGGVRLGIEAEGGIEVYREELFERIVTANREAAEHATQVDPADVLTQMSHDVAKVETSPE